MSIRTAISAVLTATVLAASALTASAANAAAACASASVEVAATPTISTVGTAVNYNYGFCYDSDGNYYTVGVMSETANASGGYSTTSASALASTALSANAGSVSGTGVFTPMTPGRYEVVVAYYMRGQAAWEDEGQTVFIVNAAPVVVVTTPTPPPVVAPSAVATPTPTPTPPAVVVVPPTPVAVVRKVAPNPLALTGKPTPPAKLSLTKTANTKTAAAGNDVRFTIVVGNISKTTARKVIVCDVLPTNTLYVSASRAVDFHGADACFAIGNLRERAHATTTLTLQLAKTASGAIVNHAQATAANAKSVYAQAQVRVASTPRTFVPAPVTG